MRCRSCTTTAVIEIPRHHAAFCAEHFASMFRGQVEKAIRRFRMLEPGDRILVAVSGGKDSLALWDVLLDAGYRATGLYLDLGIGEYSRTSRARWTVTSGRALNDLFAAVVEATEESVLNALLQAGTVVGRDGHTSVGLPAEDLWTVGGAPAPPTVH